MTARYGEGDGGRGVKSLQQKCDDLTLQKEAVVEEYRVWREGAVREAACVRAQWESKVAALTDKAFKLADPEVHA